MTVTGWGINGSMPIVNLSYASCSGGLCSFGVVTTSNTGAAQDNGFAFTIVQAK